MSRQLKLPTLLVISENPSVRLWVKKHLNDQFFVIEASKRENALEAINFSSLDFVIIDSKLEENDPIELSREIRQILKNGLTPILLITGRLKKTYRENALEAGVTDFLSDQLDIEELETRIATGRKAATIREKTIDVSSALQMQKTSSENYLKNKLVLRDEALKKIDEAKKSRVPMILAALRIDKFQEIQSNLGFLIADEIVFLLSNLLNQHLSSNDVLIPASQGKLIAILNDKKEKSAEIWALELLEEVKHHKFKTKNGEIHLTLSIAFSPLDPTESSFNKTVDAAIQTLSQADLTTNLIIPFKKEDL